MSVEYENLLPSNFPSPTRSTSKRTRAVLIVTKSKKVAPLPKTVSSPRRTSPRKPPLQLARKAWPDRPPRPEDFSFYIAIMLLFFTLMFILVSYFCFLTPPDSIFEVNYIGRINILFLLPGTHCLYCCKHKIIKYNIKKLFFALKTLSKIHSFFNVFSYK